MNSDLDAMPGHANAGSAVAQSPALGILLGLLKAAGMRAPAPISKGIRLWAAIIFLSLACGSLPAQQQDPTQNRGVTVTSSPKANKNDAWRQHKDYALLFATNEYDYWQPLVNPIPDAEAIARVLEENYSFKTELIQNPRRAEIVQKLREYINKPFGENDQLFIFFAGHGLYDETFQQGYIVARDSRQDDMSRGTYASYDDLRRIIDAIHAKHIFLVLDACYSGLFDPRIGEAGTRGMEMYADFTLPELFQKKVGVQTRRYLTSGGKDYVPDGIPNHHSPFTAHLLEALGKYGGERGFLTLASVLAAVQRTNPEPYSGEFGNNKPGSEFFFISTHLTAELEKAAQPATVDKAADFGGRGGSGIEPHAATNSRPSIAVLGFKNVSGRNDDALSTALSEFLTTELASSTELRALAGESVAKAKLDLDLKDSSGYAPDTLSRIYKALGADYVVSGSYMAEAGSKGGLQVNIHLQNAKTGEPVAVMGESGTQTAWFDLVTRAGSHLRAKLGIENPLPADAAAAKAAIPSASEGARLYADGLTKLRAYDLLGARDTLEKSVAAEPNFALAHLALARAWSELGYDKLAARETDVAMDHSARLPQPSVRTIEGTHLRLNGDWDAATEIYRSLWTVYPDETDYGLALANVQSSAGKGRDALATLDRLRKHSKQAGEDPRVDLEEAFAASTLADFKTQQSAAEKALAKAVGEGARLLSAEAYWHDCSALLGLGRLKDAEAACAQASRFSTFSGGQQVQARSLTVWASVMEQQGRISEAMELRKEALRIARDIGSKKDTIGALMNLANLQSPLEAKKGYEEAIATAREIGDEQQLAVAELGLAYVLYSEGDYGRAQEMYSQSLKTATATGDKETIARASQNLGLLSLQSGNLPEAKDKIHQSIEAAQACASRSIQASSLDILGDVLLAQDDIPGAHKAYEDALTLLTAVEDQAGIATTRQSLAELRIEEAKLGEAEALARQAVEEFEKEKSIDQEASARQTLARTLMEQGKRAEALEEIEIAGKLAVEDRAIRLSLAVTGAKLTARAGKIEEARKSLEASLAEAARLKLAGSQLEIRLMMAEFENASGTASAQSRLKAIEDDATRSGYLLIAAKASRLRRAKLTSSQK